MKRCCHSPAVTTHFHWVILHDYSGGDFYISEYLKQKLDHIMRDTQPFLKSLPCIEKEEPLEQKPHEQIAVFLMLFVTMIIALLILQWGFPIKLKHFKWYSRSILTVYTGRILNSHFIFSSKETLGCSSLVPVFLGNLFKPDALEWSPWKPNQTRTAWTGTTARHF